MGWGLYGSWQRWRCCQHCQLKCLYFFIKPWHNVVAKHRLEKLYKYAVTKANVKKTTFRIPGSTKTENLNGKKLMWKRKKEFQKKMWKRKKEFLWEFIKGGTYKSVAKTIKLNQMAKQIATGWGEKNTKPHIQSYVCLICLLPTSCVPARDHLQACTTFNGTFGTRGSWAKQGVLETATAIFEKRKLANI